MNQIMKSSVVLAFTGLGSALLSTTVESVHNFELIFVGFVFGIALAGYFVVYEKYRNPAKIAGFVCACTAAYAAALFFGIWLETFFLHNSSPVGSDKLDIPLSVFFGSGFIGAIVVFSAGVFLLGPQVLAGSPLAGFCCGRSVVGSWA